MDKELIRRIAEALEGIQEELQRMNDEGLGIIAGEPPNEN